MDLSDFKPPRIPIARTAAPMGHRDNLDGGLGDPVNYRVRETSEEKFSRATQMHGPPLRSVLDLTDGVIEFRDESVDCVRHTNRRPLLPQRSRQGGA